MTKSVIEDSKFVRPKKETGSEKRIREISRRITAKKILFENGKLVHQDFPVLRSEIIGLAF